MFKTLLLDLAKTLLVAILVFIILAIATLVVGMVLTIWLKETDIILLAWLFSCAIAAGVITFHAFWEWI